MRLFEIENHLTVWRTERFQDHLEVIMRSNPAILDILKNFILAKQQKKLFNKKDGMLTGGALHGIYRCHLIIGKIIVFYLIKDQNLYLYDINEHTAIEGANTGATARYIKKISPDKLKLYVTPTIPEKMDAEKIKILNDFLRGLIENSSESSDIGIQSIQAAIDGDWEFLQMFWVDLVNDWPWDRMISTIGGYEYFKKILSKKLAKPNKIYYESYIINN